MKEFLDSKAGRTLIIALIATGTTIFAVPWDGAETVLRAGGGAFFGALAPLVFYLMKNEGEVAEGVSAYSGTTTHFSPPAGFDDAIVGAQRFDAGIPVMSPPPAGWSVTDFDSDYHFTDDGRHLGKSVDCKLCHP